MSFNAAGALTQIRTGNQGAGLPVITETRTYNALNQLTHITQLSDTTAVINIDYRYSPSQNNGQITSMKNMMSGEEVAYQYDSLQRLISASTTGPEWGLSFSYDGFGIRLNQTVTKGSAPPSTLNYSAVTNRIITSGYSYDANGNMTAMPLMTLSYDVSNRLAQAVHTVNGTKAYRYTPDNKRVWRKVQSSNSTSEYITFYGIDGQRMAMYKVEDQGSDFRFYHNQIWRYFAGRRVLPKEDIQPSQAEDRIGSVVTANARFYPYGEEGTVTNPEGDKFATYYRDRTTALDYADQRYYGSGVGRFMTADPYQASAGAGNPASWNRYAYAEGDPVNLFDPSGLMAATTNVDFTNTNPVFAGVTGDLPVFVLQAILGRGQRSADGRDYDIFGWYSAPPAAFTIHKRCCRIC